MRLKARMKEVIVFLHKGEWIRASDVFKARSTDRTSYADAHSFTLASLRNRAGMGRDVPEWINLDTGEVRPAPFGGVKE